MTRDEVIRLAREAGWCNNVVPNPHLAALERLAALVAAHEREECAKVCEQLAKDMSMIDLWEYGECAAAIRERGKA